MTSGSGSNLILHFPHSKDSNEREHLVLSSVKIRQKQLPVGGVKNRKTDVVDGQFLNFVKKGFLNIRLFESYIKSDLSSERKNEID